jgi:nitroreductase
MLDVLEAIKKRGSVRAFLSKPVEKKLIETILDVSARAPSGVNSQPWHVCVLQGDVKDNLSQKIIKARHGGVEQHPDYTYYPKVWPEPFKARRKECGIALYKSLDIKREDVERRNQVWEDNYRFFGAPVGLIFYFDKFLSEGSLVDMGMFVENVMLAALHFGLGTCSQAALAEYPDIVRKELSISDDYHILCGMSLGYPDLEAPVNQYSLSREPVRNFVKFL